MKIKLIIAGIVIVSALIFGTISFVQTNVEYTDFQSAVASGKKVQVKGEWMKDTICTYDAVRNQFIFFMKDDNGLSEKIIYDGAKPNNFEIANAVVVKGRYHDGYFHASEILTKCPSKYEGDAETVRKTL
jgi:cytochrome c-type biogenesis protein CcmE